MYTIARFCDPPQDTIVKKDMISPLGIHIYLNGYNYPWYEGLSLIFQMFRCSKRGLRWHKGQGKINVFFREAEMTASSG